MYNTSAAGIFLYAKSKNDISIEILSLFSAISHSMT